jgi:hypothetical protein
MSTIEGLKYTTLIHPFGRLKKLMLDTMLVFQDFPALQAKYISIALRRGTG